MPLLLLDLDNTVADRDASFRHWLDHVLADGDDAVAARAELIALDADGTCPRPVFIQAARERLGVSLPAEVMLAQYREVTLAGFPPLSPAIARALERLRGNGWRIAVVTNGDAGAQERTVERIGLARHLDACIVSGTLGVRKPDPAIFRMAIAAAGSPPPPVWMVGDGHADIAGARAAGLPSIWISRGRAWTAGDVRPDAVAPDLDAALKLLSQAASSSLGAGRL